MSSDMQNVSPDLEENQQFNTFTCFPRLPKELKLEIWHFSLPQSPRVIRIRVHEHTKEEQAGTAISIRLTSIDKPEPLLSLSRPSRDVILREYASIHQPHTDAIIRFNKHIDTIYLFQVRPDVQYGRFIVQHNHPVIPRTKLQNIPRDIDMNVADMFENIQNLAIDASWGYHQIEGVEDRVSNGLFLAHFKNLKRLVMIMQAHNDAHVSYSNAPQGIAHSPWEMELQDPEDNARSFMQSRSETETYLMLANVVRRQTLDRLTDDFWMVDTRYKNPGWEEDIVVEVKGVKPDARRTNFDRIDGM